MKLRLARKLVKYAGSTRNDSYWAAWRKTETHRNRRLRILFPRTWDLTGDNEWGGE